MYWTWLKFYFAMLVFGFTSQNTQNYSTFSIVACFITSFSTFVLLLKLRFFWCVYKLCKPPETPLYCLWNLPVTYLKSPETRIPWSSLKTPWNTEESGEFKRGCRDYYRTSRGFRGTLKPLETCKELRETVIAVQWKLISWINWTVFTLGGYPCYLLQNLPVR